MPAPTSRKRRRLIDDDIKVRAEKRKRLLTKRDRDQAPRSNQCWPCLRREIGLNNIRLLDPHEDLPVSRISHDGLGILVGNKHDVVKLNGFINDTVEIRTMVPDEDEDDASTFLLPRQAREGLVLACTGLGKAFETIVACHEREHGFDKRQTGRSDEYSRLVSCRRRDASRQLPRDQKSRRLPRLLPGDRQWGAWSAALEAFHLEVADAFEESSVPDRVRETIISQIPVKREDEGRDRDAYIEMVKLAAQNATD
ncbi:hypothetical protein ACHAPT_000348 [Fusarium lateritium]